MSPRAARRGIASSVWARTTNWVRRCTGTEDRTTTCDPRRSRVGSCHSKRRMICFQAPGGLERTGVCTIDALSIAAAMFLRQGFLTATSN